MIKAEYSKNLSMFENIAIILSQKANKKYNDLNIPPLTSIKDFEIEEGNNILVRGLLLNAKNTP
jgi:hypothetical protein